jgi:hypothetical protein
MLRATILVLAPAALSGCWTSQTPLFGRDDWVQPPGLEGSFVSENAAGADNGTVELVRRPDGRIEGTVERPGTTAPRNSATGFVAIPGGSGHYFLMVASGGEVKDGELYLVTRWKDERLEAFWPQCAGTPEIRGMRRETIDFTDQAVCGFADKAAVLQAALLAERELETTRLFAPQLIGRLKRPGFGRAPPPED